MLSVTWSTRASADGAHIILPPELFSGPYFCKTQEEAHFALARPTAEHPSVRAMVKLAKQLGVAIPTSYFRTRRRAFLQHVWR